VRRDRGILAAPAVKATMGSDPIVMIEAPMETNMQEICNLMGKTPDWMPGLLLRTDGYECMFYQKD